MENNEEVKVAFNGKEKTIVCKDSKKVTIDELRKSGLSVSLSCELPNEKYSEEDFGKCVSTAVNSTDNNETTDDDKIFETLQSAMEKLMALIGTECGMPEPIIIMNNLDTDRIKKSLKKRGYKITRNGRIKRIIKSKILDWLGK
jgi:hypothetical protein